MIYGVFHGDLHGGNLVVQPDGRTALFDFGMTGRLVEPQRLAFLRLLMFGTTGDQRGQLVALRDLGAFPPDVDLDGARARPRPRRPGEGPDADVGRRPRWPRCARSPRSCSATARACPKELMLFVKNTMFLNSATAILAPDLDMLQQMMTIYTVLRRDPRRADPARGRHRRQPGGARSRRDEGGVPRRLRHRHAHLPRPAGAPRRGPAQAAAATRAPAPAARAGAGRGEAAVPELPQMQALAERLGDADHRRGARGRRAARVLGAEDGRARARVARRATPCEQVGRRAKYLILDFGDAGRILLHLSQAGRLDLEDPPKKTRAKGSVVRLRFADAPAVLVREYGHERKAAWWVLAPGDDGPLERLGPEPDSDEFAELILHGDDRRRVHTLLRDQRTVVGRRPRLRRRRAVARAALAVRVARVARRRRARPPARRGPRRDARRPRARARAHRRAVAAEAGRALRGARALRVAVPALRGDAAPGELRVARGRLLPAVPDRRQGARRPPDVAPGQVAHAPASNIRQFPSYAGDCQMFGEGRYQPREPGPPLNGPTTRDVIQPP